MRKKSYNEEHGLPSLALVFGYIAIKELQSLTDRVKVLSRLGYGDIEIAKICDANLGSVRVLKSRRGKGKPSGGRR